jgi:beta-xylosidase
MAGVSKQAQPTKTGKPAGAAAFRPGAVWLDTDGKLIQAHGGGVLFDRGTYYWFGENKDGKTSPGWLQRVDVIGVNCYSSTDLYHWKNQGVVLPAARDDPESDLHPSRVVERPKVIYNDRTRTYVMWMHIDTFDYQYARTGVAVSTSPTGPYEYLGSFRPNSADSRDMTVFKDEDGAAYLFHASEWNKTMYIARLSDDYLTLTGEYARTFVDESREAPAVFKHDGRYYCTTSGCTAWAPNPALCAVSDQVMGPWNVIGNPCVGTAEQVATTFESQATFVLPVQGRRNAFIMMVDRWNRHDLRDSRYVWLPIELHDGMVSVRWHEQWDLRVFD